jgi:hypothetical protein
MELTNVVVRADSPAGEHFRTQRSVAAVVEALEAIAPPFAPDAARDLQYFGGKTIPRLSFTSFYLGGASRWADSDVGSIDRALEKAMTDAALEDIVAQYFPGQELSSTFTGHRFVEPSVPDTAFTDTVETLLADRYRRGDLAGDLSSTVFLLLLPPGVVLVDGVAPGSPDDADSLHGLGGYHGSIHVQSATLYYAVGVYSETTASGDNGIVAFDEPWKNVVATFYHELQEVRTDPDVEDAGRAPTLDEGARFLGWMSLRDGEIGDIPIEEAGSNLGLVMREVPLADGSGTVPIQLMWSNRVHGPEGPT